MKNDQTRLTLESAVLERALKDVNFRQESLSDPKGCLEKELWIKLPESVDIDDSLC
jgi:hypothetical protein